MATNNTDAAADNFPNELVSLQVFSSPVRPPEWEANKRLRRGRPLVSPNYPEGLNESLADSEADDSARQE